MFEIGSAVAKIKADTSEFQNGLSQVGGATSGLSGIMGKLGIAISAAFVVKKVIDFGKAILDASGTFEQFRIAFDTMLGSAEKGGKLFDELQDFAKKTPFEFQGLADTTKKLLAYGVQQDKIVPTLRTLGDIASGVGMEKLPQLTLAFGQVKAMGRLTGMELRQFSEAGVPLLQTLADNFGVTTKEMTDMISAGNVGFSDVEKALSGMNSEGGKFFGLMDKQSQTLKGSLSNLGDSWQQFKAVLGDVFNPVATTVIQKLTGFIDGLKGVLQGTNENNSAFVKLGEVWNNVLLFLQPLITWFVATVIPELQKIWSEIWYFIQQVIPPLWTIIQWIFQQIMIFVGNFVKWWKENWDSISNILKGAWEIIKGAVMVAWSIVAGIITTGLKLLTGDWKGAWENIKHYADMFWEGMKSFFGGIVTFLKGWGGLIWNALTQPFEDAWNKIKDIMNNIKDALDFTKRHSPSVIDVINRGVGLANKAFENLSVGVEPIDTQKLAMVGAGGSNLAVNISLDGAIISDEYGARSMAERIGDLIINQLKDNVRI